MSGLRGLWGRSSITARLILGLTLGTTVLWCAAASFSIYVSYHELNEAFDRALQETGRRLLPLAADDLEGRESDDSRAIHHFTAGRSEYLSYQLRDASGRVLLRTHDAPILPFDQTTALGLSTVGDHRLFTDRDEATGLTITIAETTKGRDEAVTSGIRALLWPLVALIPFNIAAIWLTVRSAMRPVRRLSGDIAKRGGRNLAELDISDQPRELRPIAEAVDHLLVRLRAALDAERAFAANSAHELRTPIAGALAQTQRMIAELDDPKDRRRARDVEATLKRLSKLAEKLMQLSRADAGVGQTETEVDLIPVLDIVVIDCAKLLDDPSRIHYQKPPGVRLLARMDMDAFAIAARNLIDNAAHHGEADGPVDIRVEPEGVVRVINNGPVVPPDVLAGLKRRFARGETGHTGSGLGLAIVETIMAQTGGRLDLLSPAEGRAGGFEARLVLRA
ncbi:ATP-binding protein [Kaistia dalseonensis]|uniref:histidine kinase n=1 Tax=Kaistia dalseonensis TaxID=410840 RepID=A0ABU0HDY8_9HYPH|nr:ATP-binding protein [Kaistia dalseonensis]MCX5497533.1 ATP-binding protein [Kaistia dalseonensis]MDQ0440172.1 two-component system OmpR family sensor kinase [Kaistia dalseonensis]